MPSDLKGQNKTSLAVILVLNLVAYIALMRGDSIVAGAWSAVLAQMGDFVPASVGLVIAGLLNSQLSAEAKARLIFLTWSHPLPGSQAFSKCLFDDARINVRKIQLHYGPLPKAPREQNVLWYQIYQSIKTESSVTQVHREYLFYRDYACIAVLLLIILGAAAFAQFASISLATVYLVVLAGQVLLAGRAARIHAHRFVRTVLAVKSATL